jgi:hypothetical protein
MTRYKGRRRERERERERQRLAPWEIREKKEKPCGRLNVGTGPRLWLDANVLDMYEPCGSLDAGTGRACGLDAKVLEGRSVLDASCRFEMT